MRPGKKSARKTEELSTARKKLESGQIVPVHDQKSQTLLQPLDSPRAVAIAAAFNLLQPSRPADPLKAAAMVGELAGLILRQSESMAKPGAAQSLNASPLDITLQKIQLRGGRMSRHACMALPKATLREFCERLLEGGPTEAVVEWLSAKVKHVPSRSSVHRFRTVLIDAHRATLAEISKNHR